MKITKVGAVLLIIALGIIVVPILFHMEDKGTIILGMLLAVIAMIVDNRIQARRSDAHEPEGTAPSERSAPHPKASGRERSDPIQNSIPNESGFWT